MATTYQTLFSKLDALCLISQPDFKVITRWRQEQERALQRKLALNGEMGKHVLSDEEVIRFVQHYERLTRHIIAEMPQRADLVIHLDAERHVKYVMQR